MTETSAIGETLIEFDDNRRLIVLCGTHDENLDRIERTLDIQVMRRGNRIVLVGDASARQRGEQALNSIYTTIGSNGTVTSGEIEMALHQRGCRDTENDHDRIDLSITTRRRRVEPLNPAQARYMEALLADDMVFGIGPAGTGKTYLAVAAAVSSLLDGRVNRIILSRPAVEAGERLGFLPGDMKEKIDPYMQPLYDALRDFLPRKTLNRYLEQQSIEIAPLAFMRGRTLNSSFVILDEAQNTSRLQMKMFLTRMGHGSRMVINGDISQIDLPRGTKSGLVDARSRLRDIRGCRFIAFDSHDVVRHGLVARIIDAYSQE